MMNYSTKEVILPLPIQNRKSIIFPGHNPQVMREQLEQLEQLGVLLFS